MHVSKDADKKRNEIHRWKYFLNKKATVAKQVIGRIRSNLAHGKAARSDPHLIARSIAQLKNASAVPEDFDVSY